MEPFFTNDALVLGLLLIVIAAVFHTSYSPNPLWKKFYTIVPSILLCYFLPALLNWPLGLISGEESNLYFVASRYLLPASLVLLCLSIDLKGISQPRVKGINYVLRSHHWDCNWRANCHSIYFCRGAHVLMLVAMKKYGEA